ncbi:MAG: HNH endonuclease [Elainellaceae cyanobacterium]
MPSTTYIKHRWKVYRRDRFRCVYCRKRVKYKQLTLDHVIPRALGGTNDIDNLVTACFECNSAKGSMDPKAWISHLQRLGENLENMGQVDGAVARAISSDADYRKRARQSLEEALQECWQQQDLPALDDQWQAAESGC